MHSLYTKNTVSHFALRDKSKKECAVIINAMQVQNLL